VLPRVCRELGIPLGEYSRHVTLSILPSLVLYVALLLGLKPLCESLPFPLLMVMASCVIAFTGSAVLWFRQTATPYEQTVLNDLLGKYFRRYRKPAFELETSD